MPEGKTIEVGIIGVGGMGARHAVNLHEQTPGARVAGVYDIDGERAASVAERIRGPRVFDDPFRLIDDPSIDALVIASPDATHHDFTLACIAARKPVLCEKPLATSAVGAARIVEAEVGTGQRLVSVGLMRRFDPYHMAVHDRVWCGELGRPVLYKGVHRNPTTPYDSRGEVILTNSASHDVDAARWLLQQEVETVYVQGVRTRSTFTPESRDMLIVQLTLTGDCLAAIEVCGAADYGYEVTAEIVGQRGVATSGRPDLAVVRSGGMIGTSVPRDWLDRFREAYIGEIRAWVAAVRSAARFAGASAWDGYMTLHITDACIRSLQSGAPAAVDTAQRPEL